MWVDQPRNKHLFAADPRRASVEAALERFKAFCTFDPDTGCVLWIGGTTKGRGHHVPYPSFWFDGKRWFGHRWAAKFIHGIDIDGLHVDHCCPGLSRPNTLCVEHLQGITARKNRQLQETRKRFIHLQVGLIRYEDIYGHSPDPPEVIEGIPFFSPPAWLSPPQGPISDDCPF